MDPILFFSPWVVTPVLVLFFWGRWIMQDPPCTRHNCWFHLDVGWQKLISLVFLERIAELMSGAPVALFLYHKPHIFSTDNWKICQLKERIRTHTRTHYGVGAFFPIVLELKLLRFVMNILCTNILMMLVPFQFSLLWVRAAFWWFPDSRSVCCWYGLWFLFVSLYQLPGNSQWGACANWVRLTSTLTREIFGTFTPVLFSVFPSVNHSASLVITPQC